MYDNLNYWKFSVDKFVGNLKNLQNWGEIEKIGRTAGIDLLSLVQSTHDDNDSEQTVPN